MKGTTLNSTSLVYHFLMVSVPRPTLSAFEMDLADILNYSMYMYII